MTATDASTAAAAVLVSAPVGKLALLKPYPGLRSFTQDEASLFFGREVQARQLRDILAHRNLLVVLGGSGSGKSSLVRAGLLPKLNSTAPIPQRSGAWYPVEFRPLTNPVEELFEAIFAQIFQPLLIALSFPAGVNAGTAGGVQPATALAAEEQRRLEAVSAALAIVPALKAGEDVQARSKDRLRQLLFTGQIFDIGSLFEFADRAIVILDEKLAVGPRSGKANLLILIDQFEEVFSLPPERKEDGLNMVMSLVTSIQAFRPDNLFLIVTMRNEWLHRCSEIPGVAEAMNGSTYLVDLLGDSEVRNIIVEPARSMLRTANIDPGPPDRGPYALKTLELLQRAFDDTATAQDASDRLPLLQHMLPLLWVSAAARQDAVDGPFTIEPSHLDTVPGWNSNRGLPRCINAHAGKVLETAVEVAQKSAPILGKDGAEKLIRTAFTNLTILDEKGIVRRQFATIDQMLDSNGLFERRSGDRAEIRKALTDALWEFMAAALISFKKTASGELFDINHEALVRNWETCATWVDQAKHLKDRLRTIDEKMGSTSIDRGNWFARINDVLFAADLRDASEQVGSETAKELVDDVFGDSATFSRSWARRVLGNDNVPRIHDRVNDAQRFTDNPLHRYRALTLFMLALTSIIVVRQLLLRDMEQVVTLQEVIRPINFYQGEIPAAGPLEAFAAFEIASNKVGRALTPDVLSKPLNDILLNLEGNWRSHFNRAIWFRSSTKPEPEPLDRTDHSSSSERAVCINPSPQNRLPIGETGLVWAPITASQTPLWVPTSPDGREAMIISSLATGEDWPEGSLMCASRDGKWQLKWVNDKPAAQWPSIRNILVNRLTLEQGKNGFYVDVGNERYFTDKKNSESYRRELESAFSAISADAGQGENAKANRIRFVRNGHWVGFLIPSQTAGKTFTLWTTEGIAEPQEDISASPKKQERSAASPKKQAKASTSPKKLEDTSVSPTKQEDTSASARKLCKKEERKDGQTSCLISPLRYGQDDLEIRVTSFHPGQNQPACDSLAATCGTRIEILFIDSSRENKIRSNINFPLKRQIESGTIAEDGYLVLRDIAGHSWRYLIDSRKLAKLQRDAWGDVDLEKLGWSKPCIALGCKAVIGNTTPQ